MQPYSFGKIHSVDYAITLEHHKWDINQSRENLFAMLFLMKEDVSYMKIHTSFYSTIWLHLLQFFVCYYIIHQVLCYMHFHMQIAAQWRVIYALLLNI